MRNQRKLHSLTLTSAIIILFFILISSTASAATVTCNVVGTYYKCNSWSAEQYPSVDLFGTKYVPLLKDGDPIWKSHVNKLSKLTLDSSSKFTLKTGDKLDLGSGYSLTAKQVDVDGLKVWLEFDKDGTYIDEIIIYTDIGESARTWNCKLDKVQGEDDIPVLKVHINKVYQGAVDSLVQIDGIWLIDYQNNILLNVGDKFGSYTLTAINNGVDASNLGSLVFDGVPPAPLFAAFTASPITGNPPLTVAFTDQSKGKPTAWKWDFGDGVTSTLQNPKHIYSKPGKYTVSLTVTNASGSNTSTKTNYITVNPPKPVAAFIVSPRTGKAPLTVKFTDKSTGLPTSWSWNFGDKSTSTTKSPVHIYIRPGKYTVTLTVKNVVGSSTSKMTIIVIK